VWKQKDISCTNTEHRVKRKMPIKGAHREHLITTCINGFLIYQNSLLY
jgi:hypothetical protein